jgi:Cu+-exporting ATPase
MAHDHTNLPPNSSAIDPVCGMTVDPNTAKWSAELGGQTYYFCSESCFAKFRRDPTSFVDRQSKPASAGAASTSDHHVVHIGGDDQRNAHAPAGHPSASKSDRPVYTCPMHAEVRQIGPGACPKCGMALEPVEVAGPVTAIEYVCPMHPKIVRDAPGNCPICGMSLEARTVSAKEERILR